MIEAVNEIWKDIEGYSGFYQISNMGQIKSLPRIITYSNGKKQNSKERILKPQNRTVNGLAYKKIDLSKNDEVKQLSIHRLVASAFLINPENKPCVNHINGDASDNRVENLEWCTHKENSQHWVKRKNKTVAKKFYKQSTNEYLLSGTCNDRFADLIQCFSELLLGINAQKYGTVLSKNKIEAMKWKPIPGYDSFYIISEYGHIASLPRIVKRQIQYPAGKTMAVKGQLIRQHITTDRYQAPISKNGVYKKLYPHQLVAKTFIKNIGNHGVVNHRDGNPLNNHYSNLEWTNHSQNQLHSYKTGLSKKRIGAENCRSKKVEMIDGGNNVLRVFGSMGDIYRELGFNRTSISNVCNGKQSSINGIKFRFAC